MRNFLEVEILIDVIIENCPLLQALPVHYGWVEDTLGIDGEGLGVMVLPWEEQILPGARLKVRPVGLLRRIDGDHKLLAVLPGTNPWGNVFDYHHIDQEFLTKLEESLEQFAPLAGWDGAREAWSIVAKEFYACRVPVLSQLKEIEVCERKLTKQNVFTRRKVLAAGKNYLVTERTLSLDRIYYIDGKPVWEDGHILRRWDFPGKWFNFCQLIGRDGQTVGYYQDVQMPSVVTQSGLEAVDLVLDLWVWPDRKIKVLDADEFAQVTAQALLPEPYLSMGWQVLDEMKTLWDKGWFNSLLANL